MASLVIPSIEQLNSSGPLINNWRPPIVADGMPAELSDPVFGDFKDRLASTKLPSPESVDLAGKLCRATSEYHPDEVMGSQDGWCGAQLL